MKAFLKGRQGLWLLVLALVLAAWGGWGLLKTPGLSQYIAPAPEDMEAALAVWDKRERLGADCVSAVWTECDAQASSGGAAIAQLTAVGEGYFDLRPHYLLSGRLISQREMKSGARVAVLDQRLAFTLFPTAEPTEGRVRVREQWYDVIGVTRYSGGPGDNSEYGLMIPLAAAVKDELPLEYAVAEADGSVMGAGRALEDAAKGALGKGEYIDLKKEVMRAWMTPRILLIVFGLYGAFWCLKRWLQAAQNTVAGWRRRIRQVYLKKMLSGAIAQGALLAAGFIAVIALMAALLSLIIGPMYVFTEWVPDVIVEWSSINARLQSLLRAFAQTVRLQTPELAQARLYGGMIRWSAICGLSGLLLWRLSGRGKDTK